MQCPSCEHQATDAEFGEPAKCPACGVYYHKALAHKERLARRDSAREIEIDEDPEISEPSITDKVKRGFDGAIRAVEDGRRSRAARDHAMAARRQVEIPSAVAVVDLRMPFWSMVWFMVKWVIASIPALIILGMILVAVFSFVVGFVGSYSKYTGM